VNLTVRSLCANREQRARCPQYRRVSWAVPVGLAFSGSRSAIRSPAHGSSNALAVTSGGARPSTPATSPFRVPLVDDHDIVRGGVRSMLRAAEDIVAVGEGGGARGAVEQSYPASTPSASSHASNSVRLADATATHVSAAP